MCFSRFLQCMLTCTVWQDDHIVTFWSEHLNKTGSTVQTETTHSRFILCSVHIFTRLLHKVFLNRPNEGSSSPLCHQVVAYYSWNNTFPVVVTERDAWSLWSVSQQQTVHTSRQRRGVVAHFRTSVHDTVSVVTLSSLVPHQRLTSCTFVSVHTCVQVPKLNIHTHTNTHSHISPY